MVKPLVGPLKVEEKTARKLDSQICVPDLLFEAPLILAAPKIAGPGVVHT